MRPLSTHLATLLFGLALGGALFLGTGAFGGTPDFEECALPDADINDTIGSTSDTIEVSENMVVADVQVFLDVTHTWIGDLSVSLESPEATSVQLHGGQGGASDDLLLTWTDSGVNNGSEGYDCDCDMKPAGPGDMADFAEESSDTDWTLTVTDNAGGDAGTFNEWCLGLTLEPTVLFKRGDVDGNGTVAAIADSLALLEWQFAQGEPPVCFDAADTDDGGSVHVLQDVVFLLLWQFQGGDDPPAPGPDECGEDPSGEDELLCDEEPSCG